MSKLYCEVSEGLRKSDASIKICEVDGTPQFFPLDRGLISKINRRDAIPVRILEIDRDNDSALVTLPAEADSGATRVWVKLDDLALKAMAQ